MVPGFTREGKPNHSTKTWTRAVPNGPSSTGTDGSTYTLSSLAPSERSVQPQACRLSLLPPPAPHHTHRLQVVDLICINQAGRESNKTLLISQRRAKQNLFRQKLWFVNEHHYPPMPISDTTTLSYPQIYPGRG